MSLSSTQTPSGLDWSAAAPLPLRHLLAISAGLLALAMLITMVWSSNEAFTEHYYLGQDLVFVIAFAVLFAILVVRPGPSAESLWRRLLAARARRLVGFAALGVALFSYAGARVLFANYGLSRDEDMAEFDARIFETGRLMAQLAPEWRPYFAALGSVYMLKVEGAVAWASAYYPGNAAIRAAFGILGDRWLAGPALAALTLASVWGCARQLWPERRDAAIVACAMLVASAQFLATAMTPYAMTAHLALNSLWLWLFLRDEKWSHASAVGVGFLATGLHQIAFHPLFVAPFIAQLWMQRRRALACFYAIAYALIGLAWLKWFSFVLESHDIAPRVEAAPNVAPLSAALDLLARFDIANLHAMLRNLLRYFTWQPLLALPLTIAACAALRRAGGALASIAAGFLLTAGLLFAIMPWQGYGWGYRYLHGLLGGGALLAAWGWIVVTEKLAGDDLRKARALLVVSMALSAFSIAPARLWQARDLVLPFVNAHAAISKAPVDLVLVDRADNFLVGDLVRNDPFLRGKPLTLEVGKMTPDQVESLCGRFSIAIFDKETAAAFGIEKWASTPADYNEKAAAVRARMREIGCGAPLKL